MKKVILLALFCLLSMQNLVFAEGQNIDEFYINNLQKKIESNWNWSGKMPSQSTVINFIIDKKGSLINANILTSSGNTEFDKKALISVCKSAPFEGLPTNSQINILNFQFTFNQNYTKVSLTTQNQPNTANTKPAVFKPTETANPTKTEENNKLIKKTDNINFNPYLNSLQNKIKSNWNPPHNPESKKVVALFKVQKDGTLLNTQIATSSGNEDFDRSALAAIYKSAPLCELPKEFEGSSADIQFTFAYNVYNSSEPRIVGNLSSANNKEYYGKQIENILSYNLPKRKYLRDKSLTLKIVVNKNGQVKSVEKQYSSGDKSFDSNVIARIQKTPLPPIPASLNTDEFTFNYDINVKHKIQN